MFQKTKHIYLIAGALTLLSGPTVVIFAGFAQYYVTTQEFHARNGLLYGWITPWGEEFRRFTLILIFYDLLSLNYKDHLWKMTGAIVIFRIIFTAAHYNVLEGFEIIAFFTLFLCYSIPIVLFENLSIPFIAHIHNNYFVKIFSTGSILWHILPLVLSIILYFIIITCLI